METKEILKEGEVKHRSKLNGTTYSLITTHGCNEIVSIFVSTFLISYIYSISNNYLLNIGLFYMFSYIAMFIFYYLVSRIIDRTNRIVLYRVAIFIRAIFILMVVFLGKKLAGVVYLAGFLNGISEGFYWCSFNLMKNELVPITVLDNIHSHKLLLEKLLVLLFLSFLEKLLMLNHSNSQQLLFWQLRLLKWHFQYLSSLDVLKIQALTLSHLLNMQNHQSRTGHCLRLCFCVRSVMGSCQWWLH